MSAATPQRNVAVIGGGWAGLAAAVTLAAAGVPVAVFEAGRTLGGRARRAAIAGATLDNGQHLLLGAYRDALALIRQVQPARAASELYERTPLRLIGPGTFRLCAARLPAPLHLVAGLLAARGCAMPDRLAVVRGIAGWRRDGWRASPAQTVAGLLEGQPAAMVALLWTPLCLAALNTPPAAASAQVFLNVMRDALAAERAASDLIIPVADLSCLFPDPAARFVEAHGGIVVCGAMVRGLAVEDDESIAVEFAGPARSMQRFRDVVVATAPWQAAGLLRRLPFAAGIRRQIDGYRYQPITTVYLCYEQPVPLPARMLQLGEGPGQWLFDRSAPGAAHALLAAVISADGPHRRLAQAALACAIARQLRANLPGLIPAAAPLWTRVITEKRATHACVPQRAHPAAGHIGSRFYLAGDHTDPDYPATLEAAVRSGIRAARAVLAAR
jgi:squalene-associated FAD-dependent desaturase